MGKTRAEKMRDEKRRMTISDYSKLTGAELKSRLHATKFFLHQAYEDDWADVVRYIDQRYECDCQFY